MKVYVLVMYTRSYSDRFDAMIESNCNLGVFLRKKDALNCIKDLKENDENRLNGGRIVNTYKVEPEQVAINYVRTTSRS